MKKPLLRMLWCDRVAPLGNPVVPEVYWMLMGSSNWSRASRSLAQLVPAHGPGRGLRPQHHPACQGGQVAGHLVEHVQVVGGAEARGEHQGRHPGLAQGIGQLRGPVGRVDVDQDGPDLGGGVLESHPLGVVGRPDPDPLAGLDPEGQQPPGHLLDRGMELGVGHAHALVHADLAAVRSRFWPMVSPSNATGLAPCTYEGSLATSMAASLPPGLRAPAPFCDDIPMNPTVRTPSAAWAPESWRAFPAAQQPDWP